MAARSHAYCESVVPCLYLKLVRSLAAALLSRAIADAIKSEDADTALAWVNGYPSPLSFAWCCSVLEIEQERARGCFLALIQSPQQFRHLLPVLGRAKGSQSRF